MVCTLNVNTALTWYNLELVDSLDITVTPKYLTTNMK